MSTLKHKIKNNRVVRHIYYFVFGTLNRGKLKIKAQKTIDSFGMDFKNEKDMVVNDMVRTYARTGFSFEEYLYYGFKNLDKKHRSAFVADWEHLGYACALNNPQNDDLFDNKWITYSVYSKFYKRKMVLCKGESSFDEFSEFINSFDSFIIKPLNLSCGAGIRILRKSDIDVELKEFYNGLLKECGGLFIIEELIVQIDEMAKFHKASVNTIRIPTVRLDNEVKIIHPFMRIGQGGKCVDNGGAGGIICAVDVETGELYAAADEHGKEYKVHPESNEKIIGFIVPKWEEAKALVKELAMITPSNRYTGWDVALTEKGWVLVEANRRGQFIWQIATKEGFKNEANTLLKSLNLKY